MTENRILDLGKVIVRLVRKDNTRSLELIDADNPHDPQVVVVPGTHEVVLFYQFLHEVYGGPILQECFDYIQKMPYSKEQEVLTKKLIEAGVK